MAMELSAIRQVPVASVIPSGPRFVTLAISIRNQISLVWQKAMDMVTEIYKRD